MHPQNRRDARRYRLDPSTDERGYFEIVRSAEGYSWRWREPGEPDDESGVMWPTRAQALREAADNAEETIGASDGGARLATRLRCAATMVERAR